ncbi:hypothetical protein, variant [Aphanomyces astaci]|uniref:Spore coat protein CotH n=1 Tax=Aphanomyces astaci TaxID=112090 RepID=W4GEG8_APHAT|nr:hypothetical protein, variant [Aphanomyces astaci]ETV77469.1 hypothetical protein, variant [Aphanomyces astaci]|eukprot:XP_009833256.1 hypothetical protein, variant [Aphanomyces astaci]
MRPCLVTAAFLSVASALVHATTPLSTSPVAVNATAVAPPPSLDPQCYLMPILVLHPSPPLPTLDCVQPPLPSEDCIKATVSATLRVLQHPTDEWTCLHDPTTSTTANMSLRVRYRGDSSLRFTKHQYLLMFDVPTPLLVMPADTNWALHGPFIDGSMMRNHLAHWLYRGTGRYSPRSQHVALYIADPNGVPIYHGYYLLLETISYGPNRVGLALNVAADSDHSGGWAWQYNPLKYGTYSPNVVLDMYHGKFGMGARPLLMYPPGPTLSQRMRDEFVNVSTGFLPQYYRYLWHNMTSPLALKQHIDVGSFVDYFLHTEWSLNQDAYAKSAYFFKDRQRPIEAGPVWDLNLAYGLGSHAHADTWLYLAHPAWRRLVCNFEFANLAIARWKALRQSVWSDMAVVTFVQASASPLQRNLAKCNDWMSRQDSCASVSRSNQGTYVDQVSFLQAILLERANWMDIRMEQLYQKLDGAICGTVGDLPAFNCAEDGNDSGCLTSPAAYYSNVRFPPIRPPDDGTKKTDMQQLEQASAYDSPSIDPCWLAMGQSVTAGVWVLPERTQRDVCVQQPCDIV